MGAHLDTPIGLAVDTQGDVYVADSDDNIMFQDDKDYSDYSLDEVGLRAEWSTDSGQVVEICFEILTGQVDHAWDWIDGRDLDLSTEPEPDLRRFATAPTTQIQ